MTFHAMCNTALSEVLNMKVHRVYCLSKEKVDSESFKRVIFKTNSKLFHVDVISILPAHLIIFLHRSE